MIISDPARDPQNVVIVNLTTSRSNVDDRTCVVSRGEHVFVSRESVVVYAEARIVPVVNLRALLRSRSQPPPLSRSADLSQTLISRVQAGVGRSRHVPLGVRQILSTQGFLEGGAASAVR
jgi:hypothetical protein